MSTENLHLSSPHNLIGVKDLIYNYYRPTYQVQQNEGQILEHYDMRGNVNLQSQNTSPNKL